MSSFCCRVESSLVYCSLIVIVAICKSFVVKVWSDVISSRAFSLFNCSVNVIDSVTVLVSPGRSFVIVVGEKV